MVKEKQLVGGPKILIRYIKGELTKVKLFCLHTVSEKKTRTVRHLFPKVNFYISDNYQVSLKTLRFLLKNYCRCFIMEKEQSSRILCRLLDEIEEVVIDRERNVFDPILSICSVSVSKEHLWQYNSQGNDILNVYNSFLY